MTRNALVAWLVLTPAVASAQAVQAFNVSQGWPDALGLPELPLFP